MTEAKPRLLLQHSRPDHEVSKPSSDSHRSLTDLEHAAVNEGSPSILASLWDPPPGWLCPSEFELAVAADRSRQAFRTASRCHSCGLSPFVQLSKVV